MSKFSFALGMLVLAFAFHSIHAQGAAQPAETKAGTATVSGRVTLKGEPARGVMVILRLLNSPVASNSPRAKADKSGRFQITGVAAGSYRVSAIAPGYVTPGDSLIDFRDGQTLSVAEGEKIENVDIEIKRGGVIAGRVTDSQNRPVIEETIYLLKFDRNNRPQDYRSYIGIFDMSRTDDRGFYRIYGLPEGRFLVSVGYAEMPGSSRVTSSREFYPRVFYPNVTSESKAKAIEVSEGSEATDVDITVPDSKQTRDVSGRVVDAGAGQPVAGVEVVVGGLTKDGKYVGGWDRRGALSGPNGEFRLFGVLPGKYAILTLPDGALGGGSNNGGYISDISEPTIIDISEGDATGVEVKVRQGASISGVAVIEGTNDPKTLAKLSQVNLIALIIDTGTTTSAPPNGRPFRVNSDGSFRINGLQAGKARIVALPPPDMRGLRVGRIEYNGAPAPQGIELDPWEQVTGVRVVLVNGTLTLRGELKIIGGAIPAGQRFRVSTRRVDQQMQNSPGAEVDARGQFIIENMTPGEYELSFIPFFNPNNEQLNPQLKRRLGTFKERVVVAVGNQQPVTLVIDLSQKEGNK
jgi:carboxypeptidase family protein